MVIDDFNVARPGFGPNEANPPLQIYTNAVLSGSLASQ